MSFAFIALSIVVSGNPVIFTPNRKLIREGEVERVKLKKTGEVDTKLYYAHLFNDAFIYSSRNRVTGGFKLHVAVDLKGCTLNHSQMGGSKIFSLVGPKENVDEAPKLRFPKAGESWFLQIQVQIDALKTAKKDKRSSTFAPKAQVGLPGVDASALGVRGMMIYQFLLAEIQFADLMSAMNVTVIQPLIDASKGAVLSAVKIKNLNTAAGSADAGPELKDLHSDLLFNSNASSVSKSQALVIKEALSDPDVKIFLRAAEGIALASRDFVSSLETLCTGQNWTENTTVGSYFNSVSALALYNQFKAYTDGQQAMLRILRTAPFAQFYRDAETFLSAYPGSFAEKVEQPRQRVNHYTAFLFNLKNCTNPGSSDFGPIEVSLSALTFVNNEIQELIRVKENFEKLLEIQACFINNFLTIDPVLAKLASTDRTFIKDGDLKKVCRKKNKTFRFWLFNDYLLYGTALGAGNYSFNRALDLKTCSVKAHESAELKNAFEIFGAEKSFIVIAPTKVLQDEWLQAIKSAKAAIMGVTVESLDSATTDSAPLWVPDSESAGCTVCQKGFTFWNRRHHCRKCGSLVCNDHLQKKMILPHIHKTSAQKVCDNCFNGVSPVASATAGASAKSATSENKTTTTAPVSASTVSAPQMSKAQAQYERFPSAPTSPVPGTPPAAPTSPVPPAKPARPTSIAKPPKPAKTLSSEDPPNVSNLSVSDVPLATPSKPAPSAPPPLPSTPPPPVPSCAPPAVPPSEEEQSSGGGLTPTRRGSTSKRTTCVFI